LKWLAGFNPGGFNMLIERMKLAEFGKPVQRIETGKSREMGFD
jgi:hypothetical protein